jgi:hypothetical protein
MLSNKDVMAVSHYKKPKEAKTAASQPVSTAKPKAVVNTP